MLPIMSIFTVLHATYGLIGIFFALIYGMRAYRLQFTANINRSGLQHTQYSGIKGEKP